ncbi:hypothetical protein HKD37_01G001859 [Glycine soja]
MHVMQDRIQSKENLSKRNLLVNTPQQHYGTTSGKKARRALWGIWDVIVWKFWKQGNDVIFNNAQPNLEKMVDHIKMASWNWLKTQSPGFNFSLSANTLEGNVDDGEKERR